MSRACPVFRKWVSHRGKLGHVHAHTITRRLFSDSLRLDRHHVYSSFLVVVVLVPCDALLTGSSLTRSPTRTTTTTTTTHKSLKWLGLVERISYTQLTENRVRTVCTEWAKNHFLLKRIGNFEINKINLSLHLDVVLKRNFFFFDPSCTSKR